MTEHLDNDATVRNAVTAARLMRMALALLDRSGEDAAAARLQHALDTLERKAPGPPTTNELHGFLDR